MHQNLLGFLHFMKYMHHIRSQPLLFVVKIRLFVIITLMPVTRFGAEIPSNSFPVQIFWAEEAF